MMEPEAPQDLILAITIGQRDLQVLLVGESGLCRVSPRRTHIGPLHRALRDGNLPFGFWVPLPSVRKPAESEEVETHYESGQVKPSSTKFRLATAADLPDAEPTPGAMVWLTPGLLAEKLRAVERELHNDQVRLCRVLLFHTDRGEKSDRASREPVAVVPILTAWMCKHLGIAVEAVKPVCCLGEGESLTERDAADNTHLRRDAAAHIDTALFEAARTYPGAIIRLHIAGGIPAIGEVVQASAQMRFPVVQYRSPTEDAWVSTVPARVAQPSASTMLQARREARDLIRRSEFQAAAVLASSLEGPSPASNWTRCVRAVARYFQGYMTDAAAKTAALPLSCATKSQLEQLLDSQWPQALHVGLRAEAALRSDDFLNAASLTVTFLDVVLMDAVERVLSKPGSEKCVNWITRRIRKYRLLGTLADFKGFIPRILHEISWLRTFEEKDVEKWFSYPELQAHTHWEEYLLIYALGEVGKRPELATALDQLSTALHQETSKGHVPADFRNRIIHSLPSQAEIELMLQLFVNKALWRYRKGEPRSFLHPEACAHAVLNELGVTASLGSYNDLVNGLIADIENCPLA